MVIVLVMTSLLSWYVGYGKLILQRIEQLDAQRFEIADALDLLHGTGRVANQPAPTRGTALEAWLLDEGNLLERCGSSADQDPKTVAGLKRACTAAHQLQQKRSAADEALTEWTSYALWLPRSAARFATWIEEPTSGFTMAERKDRLTANQSATLGNDVPMLSLKFTPPERKEQWAANLLAILGNNVLPMMYGFLGAAVAAMLNLNSKIRSSLLSPRDRRMNHVQLVLGIITGACIGLFLTPSSTGTSSATLSGNSVPLSASALSFLAGFGVEGVFKMLENILITVFGGQPRTPPPAHQNH